MAVQKSRVSPSRKGMRRAHDALSAKQLATDPTTGETHVRHHVTADGYYRGKQVIAPKVKVVEEDWSHARSPARAAIASGSRFAASIHLSAPARIVIGTRLWHGVAHE